MTFAATIRDIETAALSDVGRVRSENQDACAEMQSPAGTRLLVVADGMGGHQGGSMASRLAIETINDVFRRGDLSGEALLEAAIREANTRVNSTATQETTLYGMGTTVVALLLDSGLDSAWIAHVGDSRIYRLRDGLFEQLTEDHSAVAEMVRRGVITPEEAETHPRRNEILRSLGVEAETKPTLANVELRPGDQLLLCSDGLSGVLSDEEIAAVLQRTPPTEAVRTLVDTVNARGAPDNVTVMIAAVPRAGQPTVLQPASDALPGRAASRPNIRYVAAATAGVALALLLALIVMIFRHDWSGDASPDMAFPVDAGPNVAAPPDPDRNDRESLR
jgi:protein phosphatase